MMKLFKTILPIFFLITVIGIVPAHGDEEHIIGDRATEVKNGDDMLSTKDIHPSLSEIRKMHPEFLMHKRDKTLRQGIRTKRNSLKMCVNCHSTIKGDEHVPINQKGQFCSTCHEKVGTSLDCFSCHRTTPQEDL